MKRFLIFLFSILFPINIYGTTYYVSPNGDNSNDGSINHPWATPGYASKQLHPGDTLIIKNGEYLLSQYWDDMITPAPGGSENQWITIKGESSENRPVLRGRNNLLCAIDLGGCSYVKIENLEITNYNGENFREGIDSWNEAKHIELKNIYIHHVDEMGINMKDVDDIKILNCEISHCGFGALGGPRGDHGGWRNLYIENSNFSYSGHYYQGGSGPSPYDRPDGFGIEPSNGPIEVKNCIFSHNRGDGFDCKAKNTRIYNSIISNNSCDGLKLWGDNSIAFNCLIYGRGDGDYTNTPWGSVVIDTPNNATIKLINLTIHQDDELEGYPMYVQYGESGHVNLTMTNCIIYASNSQVYFGENVTLNASHNIFYIKNSSTQVEYNHTLYTVDNISNLGMGNFSQDPLFVNPDKDHRNFHLQSQSPAIDSGIITSDTPDFDLENNPRPQGREIDIGCYEYSSTCQVGDISKDGIINILDLMLIKNYLVGNISISNISCGDLNQNGEIDTQDSLILSQYLAGNLNEL